MGGKAKLNQVAEKPWGRSTCPFMSEPLSPWSPIPRILRVFNVYCCLFFIALALGGFNYYVFFPRSPEVPLRLPGCLLGTAGRLVVPGSCASCPSRLRSPCEVSNPADGALASHKRKAEINKMCFTKAISFRPSLTSSLTFISTFVL